MAICGKDCSFKIDGAALPEGSSVNIQINREEVDEIGRASCRERV